MIKNCHFNVSPRKIILMKYCGKLSIDDLNGAIMAAEEQRVGGEERTLWSEEEARETRNNEEENNGKKTRNARKKWRSNINLK